MQSKGKKMQFLEAHGWIITEERSVEKENPAGIEEGSNLRRKLYLSDHKSISKQHPGIAKPIKGIANGAIFPGECYGPTPK